MTYYEILEVSENASQEVIHMAYKALAKRYHPDLFIGDSAFAEEQMKRINAAYQVLSDANRRRGYDDFLRWERRMAEGAEGKQGKRRKPKKEKAPPTLKRSIITVGILLFLALSLQVAIYILQSRVEDYPLTYALFVAFVDFVALALGHMFFPLLIGSIKKECSITFIETMSWINSVAFVVLTNVLLDSASGSGWVLIIFYSFINKHVLYQMHQKIKRRGQRVIAALSVLMALAITLTCCLCGLFFLQDIVAESYVTEASYAYDYADTPETDQRRGGKRYYITESGRVFETFIENGKRCYIDDDGTVVKIQTYN